MLHYGIELQYIRVLVNILRARTHARTHTQGRNTVGLSSTEFLKLSKTNTVVVDKIKLEIIRI
jgi:hypothetical protein